MPPPMRHTCSIQVLSKNPNYNILLMNKGVLLPFLYFKRIYLNICTYLFAHIK